MRPPRTVGCTQPPFWWRCNRGVITAGIHGNGDNASPDDGVRGTEEDRGEAPEEAHRRSGEAPRVTMQKLAYVSCVRANTDPERKNHESGTGVFLIGRGTSTGCGGRPVRVGAKHPRIIPYSLHVTTGNYV